jgi:hypothetical protein
MRHVDAIDRELTNLVAVGLVLRDSDGTAATKAVIGEQVDELLDERNALTSDT